MPGQSRYRRVLLGMGPGRVNRQVVRTAVEFARLLELEVVGVFVEDEVLLALGRLPFLREFRLPGNVWESLDPARVADELRAGARDAEGLLQKEGAALGMSCRFETRRGDAATLVGRLCEVTDIVAFGELVPGTSRRTLEAAITSSASVLLLPSTSTPAGPIAVVAPSHFETAVSLARQIADVVGEELVSVRASQRPAEALAIALDQAVGAHRERLIVLSRESAESDDAVVDLVARRGVPVLLVGAGARVIHNNPPA